MKLNGITKNMKCLKVLIGILFASMSYDAFADAIAPCSPGKINFRAFGGIGDSSKTRVS